MDFTTQSILKRLVDEMNQQNQFSSKSSIEGEVTNTVSIYYRRRKAGK